MKIGRWIEHTFPCQSAPVYGCTDPSACNYDPLATMDDGTLNSTSSSTPSLNTSI